MHHVSYGLIKLSIMFCVVAICYKELERALWKKEIMIIETSEKELILH